MNYEQLTYILREKHYVIRNMSPHGSPCLGLTNGCGVQYTLADYSSEKDVPVKISLSSNPSILEEQVALGRFLAEKSVPFSLSGRWGRDIVKSRIKTDAKNLKGIIDAEKTLKSLNSQ